jgi:hypothetical protein
MKTNVKTKDNAKDKSIAKISGGKLEERLIAANPCIRTLLLETVWRLARWQPDYKPVRALAEGIIRGAARKKLAVAAARKLAVDIWRLATGKTTPEKLGLLVTGYP